MILGGSVVAGPVRGRPIDPATTRQLVNPIPVAIEALMECCEMTPKNRRMKTPARSAKVSPPSCSCCYPSSALPRPLRFDAVRFVASGRLDERKSILLFVACQARRGGPETLREGLIHPPFGMQTSRSQQVVIRTAKSAMQAPPMKERVSYFLLSPTGRGTGGGGNRQR